MRSLYSKNKLNLRPDRAYPATAPDINVAGIYNSVENLTTAKAPENPPTNNPITPPQQLIASEPKKAKPKQAPIPSKTSFF